MDQHPVGIDIVVGLDDAAVPVAMGLVTMGGAVDREITPGEIKRRKDSVNGTLRMAIEEDFVGGGRNTQTRGAVVMGRAAGLPLVAVLPGMLIAVRNGCSQGSGIGAGCEYGIH
jgi:hypothetical protein